MDLILRRLHIHMVEAGAPQKDSLHLHLVKLLYHRRIDVIVYENTDGVVSLCQKDRFLLKRDVIKTDLKPVALCHRFKPYPVIWFGTEKCDLHIKIPPQILI